MSLSISKNNTSDVEENNIFFNDLIDIMTNEEFKTFYNKYFTDWNDIQAMVFFMKLYSTIDYEFTRQFNKQIDKSEMQIVLSNVMNNSNTRKIALSLFNDYKDCTDYKKTESFRTLLSFSKPNHYLSLESDVSLVSSSSTDFSTDDTISSIACSIISSVISTAIETNASSASSSDVSAASSGC